MQCSRRHKCSDTTQRLAASHADNKTANVGWHSVPSVGLEAAQLPSGTAGTVAASHTWEYLGGGKSSGKAGAYGRVDKHVACSTLQEPTQPGNSWWVQFRPTSMKLAAPQGAVPDRYHQSFSLQTPNLPHSAQAGSGTAAPLSGQSVTMLAVQHHAYSIKE
jgi:hypothetical protein